MHTVEQMPGANGLGSKITVGTTARTLEEFIQIASSDPTFKIPEGVNSVDIFPETGETRWFDDGNVPTASLGNPITGTSAVSLRGIEMTKFKLIQKTATATMTVRLGHENTSVS